MSAKYDDLVETAQSNETGAARCALAPKVDLLVSDRGDTFTVWDYRPRAKRAEKPVSAAWAHKFLGRALALGEIESVSW